MRPRAATSWRASRSQANFSASVMSAIGGPPLAGMRGDLSRCPEDAPGPDAAPGSPASSQELRSRGLTWPLVLVLLPPSETKSPGGSGAPLDLSSLSSPALAPVRAQLVEALVALAADLPAARAALGLSAQQDGEIARNAALLTSP